jgi:hypothetical protein
MDKREKLKELINNSPSLEDDERKLCIDKVAGLNDDEVDEAIEVLEWEGEKWEELRKDDEVSLSIFNKYVDESNKEIDKDYRQVVKKIEGRKTKEDSKKADQLLKNL